MNRLFITTAAAATAGILVGFVAGAGFMAVRMSDDEEPAVLGPRPRSDRECLA